MKKLVSIAAIAVCVCVLFASCEKTPEPQRIDPNDSPSYILLNNSSVGSFNANVYNIIGSTLSASYSTIELLSDLTPIEMLMETLLAQKTLNDIIPDDMHFVDAYVSYGVCIVKLEGTFPEKIDEWLNLEAVIMPTLHDFCGVDKACILLNGSMPAYKGLPMGVISYSTLDYEEYVRNRRDLFNDTSNLSEPVESELAYFTPIADTDFICAKTISGSVFVRSENMRSQARALMDLYSQVFTKVYNKDMNQSFKKCFSYKFISDDELLSEFGVASIKITKSKAFSIDSTVLANAVALTIMCNTPGINQVNVEIDDDTISCTNNSGCDIIATNFTAFYPMHDEGTLEKKEIILQSELVYDAQAILSTMLSEDNTSSTLFPNYLAKRLTATQMSGDVLVVQFPKDSRDEVLHNFVESSEHYDSPDTRERMFVFSIVNTLAQLPVVERVLFVDENNDPVDALLNINLKMPIYPNPGLETD